MVGRVPICKRRTLAWTSIIWRRTTVRTGYTARNVVRRTGPSAEIWGPEQHACLS